MQCNPCRMMWHVTFFKYTIHICILVMVSPHAFCFPLPRCTWSVQLDMVHPQWCDGWGIWWDNWLSRTVVVENADTNSCRTETSPMNSRRWFQIFFINNFTWSKFDPILTIIFQLSWNHQLVSYFMLKQWNCHDWKIAWWSIRNL